MASRLRAALAPLFAVSLVFAAAGGAGFVYAHNPQPAVVSVRVTGQPPPAAEQFTTGTIAAIRGQAIDVNTGSGTESIDLPSGVTIEELIPAAPSAVTIGDPANVGGNATPRGLVLTGVVVIALDRYEEGAAEAAPAAPPEPAEATEGTEATDAEAGAQDGADDDQQADADGDGSQP